jgi:hypothetical protein
MGGSWDLVIVGLLVGGACVWAVRALVRSLKKPGGCSSCGSSGDCPLTKGSAGGACATEEAERQRQGVALH